MKKLGEYHDLYLKSVHYFWQMFLKTLEICVSKSMN